MRKLVNKYTIYYAHQKMNLTQNFTFGYIQYLNTHK